MGKQSRVPKKMLTVNRNETSRATAHNNAIVIES